MVLAGEGTILQYSYFMANAYNRGIHKKKLLDYSEKMESNTVTQRLGYVTELLIENNIVEDDAGFLSSIQGVLSDGASNTFLASVSKNGRIGTLNTRWKIIENVQKERLFGEIIVK